MADTSDNSKQDRFVLTEEDIPGAKLPRKSPELCSVVQLRRWLLCRGAKTSGKKASLVARVNDYMSNGLDKKYLKDPDGGIHLMKKKAQLGVVESEEPENPGSFPTEGFKTDLTGLPKLSFPTIWRYMIDEVEAKRQLSTAKPLVKGYNFYKSGHVLFLCHLRENNKHYIKSKVLPSMKKSSVYSCLLVLSTLGTVLRASCGCPAGIDGRCNHVAATLFALEEQCKQTKQNESCTSKPCKWSVPKKRTGSVVPISQMKFAKHDYAKKTKERKSSMPNGHDVRAIHQRQWPVEKVSNMLKVIKAYQEKTGNTMGWSHILPQDTTTNPANKGDAPVQEQPGILGKHTSQTEAIFCPVDGP